VSQKETGRRYQKATGVRGLPFHGHERDKARLPAANIASDLLVYLHLLGLEEAGELAAAEPETPRTAISRIPLGGSRPSNHYPASSEGASRDRSPIVAHEIATSSVDPGSDAQAGYCERRAHAWHAVP
jgi:hypothetical protein